MLINLSLLLHPGTYPEQSRTSKMEIFAKIANSFEPLTIFANSYILDVRLRSDYVSTISTISSGIYLQFYQELQDNFYLQSFCRSIISVKKFFPVAQLQNSVSNRKSNSITKLEIHSCKKEFLPSCKKYCWKTSRNNLLKPLNILIENSPFRQLITQR